MQVEVLLFGPAAMAAGADRVTVSMPERPTGGTDSATARDITAALIEQHPALRFALSAPRLAVNQKFASPDTVVRPGDEVALITLVGGG